jgi:hypothetical protein
MARCLLWAGLKSLNRFIVVDMQEMIHFSSLKKVVTSHSCESREEDSLRLPVESLCAVAYSLATGFEKRK